MKKKFLVLLLSIVVTLPYAGGVAQATEQVSEPDQTRENLEKIELYQMMDSSLREIGLSLELLSKTQIDFENLDYESPVIADSVVPRGPDENIEFKETNEYLSINEFARKRYGNNPTEEEKMKMYLLYYFDVKDADKAAGRVGPKLRMDYYYPEYMGENDESAYQAFIKASYGGKLMKKATNTANLINNASGLEKVNLSRLKKNYKSIKTWVGEAKNVKENVSFLKDAHKYMSDEVLRNVKTTEDFIYYWDEAISKTPGERIDEKCKVI
ncbi:hypothetical protein I6N95_25375 [Vagococcus sp. BWB3-3]|uniref:Uncharacterized protein n=1 Tax=Vagococcus allomyrinae TaxID=2794353 RepID=A0A940PB36_9ENTE|nr:hypothetical protein [Vagococcus allomyrinae]MBP1044345.1 hypothetical protein [Vagococcus allomyrinae]